LFFAGSYYDDNNPFQNNGSTTYSFNFQPQIGYEWGRSISKLKTLFGVDLIGIYNKYSSSDYQLYKQNLFGGGISTLIGVEYRINALFSISTETDVKFIYKFSKESHDDQSGNVKNTEVYISRLGFIYFNIFI
jgi:hypothetical protein